MTVRKQGYSADDIATLAAILARQSPGIEIDTDALRTALMSLMTQVGRAAGDDPETAQFWDEAVSMQPPHDAVAARFRAIAEAPDPFAPGVMDTGERLRINAYMRGRWPIRRAKQSRNKEVLFVDDMEKGMAMLREAARRLAQYHQGFVRTGAPPKNDHDTILLQLGDLFCSHAGLSCSRYDLPHAERSRFITFVVAAMHPFFDTTEATPKALSRRWKKIKDRDTVAIPDQGPEIPDD